MIRPIDVRVAFNALPDAGARVSQEMAATQYRQVQEFRDSRAENLNRPTRVMENASVYAPVLRGVEQRSAEPSARQQEVRERARRRSEEDRDSLGRPRDRTITYSPTGLQGLAAPGRYSSVGAGELLDRIA